MFECVGGKIFSSYGVADFFDYAASNFFNIDGAEILSRNFAEIYYDVGADGRFACHVRIGVQFKACIEDCIGDLIGYFVGMPFRNGFRRENMAVCVVFHFSFPVDSACVTP